MQIFLGVLAATLGAWLLASARRAGVRFALALVCGIVGTYSFGSGLTFWVAGTAGLGLNPALRRPAPCAAWLLVGGACVGAYFVGYHLPPGHGSLGSNFSS